MTQLKICGIQPGDDLSFTEEPAVHYIGIIFVRKSRRYVHPVNAKLIRESVHQSCRTMGVFVNTPAREVMQTAKTAKLDGVQLHGSETVADCQVLQKAGLRVWKSVTAHGHQDLQRMREAVLQYSAVTDAILLDAPAPSNESNEGVTGGFGLQFDWSLLPLLFDDDFLAKMPSSSEIWIAGGLKPANLHQLRKYWHPFGIDVSSGVEENGRKSPQRISDMIEAVKQLD
ncbi:phosphoribosylanthranilate isomerase [Alicyclobacillus sp. SO9]|uniref:phosphoribosylanthranilate isomerase n=1 Tax=Alicyclobacillus sp. SO9 TaxID=2665646 RepID=UPI0018E90A4A|nr:phosphoribosylanthranilate isomerase [Alicyclobacillus sp. SO9]QQE76798.1 phosphoribosylanthranilate isomerase [Alicyclobacillus sp. SO9]